MEEFKKGDTALITGNGTEHDREIMHCFNVGSEVKVLIVNGEDCYCEGLDTEDGSTAEQFVSSIHLQKGGIDHAAEGTESKTVVMAVTINVTEHIQKTIEILDELCETKGIYDNHQVAEMRQAQLSMISVFGRQDIRHQAGTFKTCDKCGFVSKHCKCEEE